MRNKGAKIFVNSITMTRVIGTLLLPFMSLNMSSLAVVLYIIALLLTDSLDGFLARKLNACTIFGALLDAAADKLLGIATLCVIAYTYPIMLLPVLVETVITLINVKGVSKGSSMESSTLGKIKTWVLGVIIVVGFCTVFANEIMVLIQDLNNNILNDLFEYLKIHHYTVVASLAFIATGADIMVAADYKIRVKQEILTAEASGLKAKEMKLKTKKDLMYALFDEEYYKLTKNQPLLQRLGETEKNYEKINRK